MNPQAHFSLIRSSYFSSSNNCSAFNKRKIIIKIVIVKKVIYIINFLLVHYSGIFCTWPRTKLPMYTEMRRESIDLESAPYALKDKVPFSVQGSLAALPL